MLKNIGRKVITAAFMLAFSLGASAQSDSLSLTIEKAKEYARENNYMMKNARQDVIAARKKVWETTAIGLPQVNANIDYQNNLTVATMPLTITGPDGTPQTSYIQMGTPHSASAGVTATQLIFDGSYIVGLQSATTYKKISELAEFKSETMVDEAVLNAYGGVILGEETVKILEGNIETLQSNLDQTKAYYENGLVEEQNFEQLQILLSSTQNLLFSAKKDLEVSYQMLNYTLGFDINQAVKLENGLEYLLLSNLDTTTVKNSSLNIENNIDIEIQNNQVKSQELLKKLEQSKFLPSVSAFYQGKYDAFNEEFKFFSNEQEWFGSQMLGVSVKIPVFSSFQRSSKVQQAKIELEKAKTSRDEATQQLLMNFNTARNSYLSAVNQFFTARANMELATKIRKKEEIKFFEGMSSSLDLSNAEVQMFDTQRSYIQSIMVLIRAKAALDKFLVEIPEEK